MGAYGEAFCLNISGKLIVWEPMGRHGNIGEYGVLGNIGECQVEANRAAQQSTLHVLV